MPGDWADEDLLKSTAEIPAPAPPRRRAATLILIAALLGAAGGAWYAGFGNWGRSDLETTAAPKTPVAGADYALGSDPFSVDVPPLDESDSVVAGLVAKLSSHPRVAMRDRRRRSRCRSRRSKDRRATSSRSRRPP